MENNKNIKEIDDFEEVAVETTIPASLKEEEHKEINPSESTEIAIIDEELKDNDVFLKTMLKYNNIIDLIKSYILINEENKGEAIVSLNLNKIDPLEAKNHLEKAYKELKLDVELVDFLNANKFENINKSELIKKDDFKTLNNSEQSAYIENAISRLSKNDTLKNEDFIRKLYKLKRIEILVEDSINLADLKDKYLILMKQIINELNLYIKEVFDFYENKQIGNSNNNQIDYNNNISELEEEIESIRVQLNEVLKENENSKGILEEKINEITSLKDTNRELKDKNYELENKVEELQENLNKKSDAANETTSKIDVDFSILKNIEGVDVSKEPSEIIIDVLDSFEIQKQTIDNLKQEKMNLPSQELYDNALEELKKLDIKVKDLEDEIIEKETFIRDLTVTQTKEDKDTKKDFINMPKEKKSMPKWAKILIIVFGVFVTLFVLLRVTGSMINLEDEPKVQANYVEPTSKNTSVNTPSPVVSGPTPQEITSLYNFEKEIPVEEFQNQKFDIFTDNWEKIRVNGKEFLTNQVINGYQFIRANSSGKILFMTKNQDPIWIEMR